MKYSKTEAKEKVAKLVQNYEKLAAASRLPEFNEANTRKDFIMPLFEALGWGVRNFEEVAEEERVSNGNVDYAFKINGVTKFYLETKKFSVDLEEEKWAEQAINYAWYKSVTWAVLSDFEGIKIFNAEWKESHVSKNIFLDLKYSDYINNFDDLWLLSKDGIENELINKVAEKYGKKQKRKPVGEAIFEDLIEWRRQLLESIDSVSQSFELSDEERDEIVQKILDRLIFIRTCEDRGIEDKRLQSALRVWQDNDEKGSLYEKIVELFKHYYLYDTALFTPNHPCEKTNIFNGTIRDIIKGLYYNYSEKIHYDFKNIPADILGGIYEQYLGHILKKGKLIEGMPHRKERGIYYTPKHIVDYIVENTLVKKLKEIPRVEAGKIKILDPACGSGSFLIKALDVMDKFYEEDPQFKKYPYSRRVKALQNNIYGVDLDEKAIEIAQLNLMLRALEDRRALPNISSNIKCGNSLISGSEEELKKYFGSNWKDKKPFNWEEEFPDVFKQGGFDIIIGNPPYIKEYTNKSAFEGLHKSLYYQGKMDIWTLFACIAIDLLKEGGYFSFIAPNNWLTNAGASIFRNKILSEGQIIKFVDFGDFKVFKEAGIQTMIFVFKKTKPKKTYKVSYAKIVAKNIEGDAVNVLLQSGLKLARDGINKFDVTIDPTQLIGKNIVFVNQTNDDILSKIESKKNFELTEKDVAQGIVGAPDKYFIINDLSGFKKEEWKFIKPFYTSTAKYSLSKTNLYIFYLCDKNFRGENIENYPNIKNHFEPFKKQLKEAKIKYNTPDKLYFYLHREREEKFFKKGPKIAGQTRTSFPSFLYTEEEYYGSRAMNFIKTDRINLKYLTGLLNSQLCFFWLKNKGKQLGNLLQIDKGPLLNIPLIKPSESLQSQVSLLVDQETKLCQDFRNLTKNTNKWHVLKQEIEKTDRKIDEEVYKLYGLTEEEIGVVEKEYGK